MRKSRCVGGNVRSAVDVACGGAVAGASWATANAEMTISAKAVRNWGRKLECVTGVDISRPARRPLQQVLRLAWQTMKKIHCLSLFMVALPVRKFLFFVAVVRHAAFVNLQVKRVRCARQWTNRNPVGMSSALIMAIGCIKYAEAH